MGTLARAAVVAGVDPTVVRLLRVLIAVAGTGPVLGFAVALLLFRLRSRRP